MTPVREELKDIAHTLTRGMGWGSREPFWLSATFETFEIIVAGNLPPSRLHWVAFGGNGNSPHLQSYPIIMIIFGKYLNISFVAIYETAPELPNEATTVKAGRTGETPSLRVG
ncbi:MAG: hypothetical protein G5Z42_02220 [Caldisphaeraceae archaeon]|nr:hypothetical protein [Caldisphaeraceae archaeon]